MRRVTWKFSRTKNNDSVWATWIQGYIVNLIAVRIDVSDSFDVRIKWQCADKLHRLDGPAVAVGQVKESELLALLKGKDPYALDTIPYVIPWAFYPHSGVGYQWHVHGIKMPLDKKIISQEDILFSIRRYPKLRSELCLIGHGLGYFSSDVRDAIQAAEVFF